MWRSQLRMHGCAANVYAELNRQVARAAPLKLHAARAPEAAPEPPNTAQQLPAGAKMLQTQPQES
eukprot:2991634-Alexandrium_andersonii.AAC.1